MLATFITMTRQMFYRGGRNSSRNLCAKFRFVKLFRFAASRPRWQGKNFESAKTRTKYHYHRRRTAAAHAIRIRQRCRRAFLSPWRTIEQNELSDVPAAAELIATRVITAFRKRYAIAIAPPRWWRVRRRGGRVTGLQDGNHQCSP